MSKKNTATAADVRAWALKNDLPAGGSRGRLPADTVEAFNAANDATYAPAGERKRKVTAMRVTDKGRKVPVTRTVNVADVREFAVENGLAKPGRGRLPEAAFQAFALAQAK